MKHSTIIKKLKKQINTKGYVENLGQKELNEFSTYIFNKLSYNEAAKAYTALSNEIDSL